MGSNIDGGVNGSVLDCLFGFFIDYDHCFYCTSPCYSTLKEKKTVNHLSTDLPDNVVQADGSVLNNIGHIKIS